MNFFFKWVIYPMCDKYRLVKIFYAGERDSVFGITFFRYHIYLRAQKCQPSMILLTGYLRQPLFYLFDSKALGQ